MTDRLYRNLKWFFAVLIIGNTLAMTGTGLPAWLTWPLAIATTGVFLFVFLGRVMAPMLIWLFGR